MVLVPGGTGTGGSQGVWGRHRAGLWPHKGVGSERVGVCRVLSLSEQLARHSNAWELAGKFWSDPQGQGGQPGAGLSPARVTVSRLSPARVTVSLCPG